MGVQKLSDTRSEPTESGEVLHEQPRRTVLPRLERNGGRQTLVVDHRLRYEQERIVGEGGMGEVWLARDNDIGRRVALKRLHSDQSDGHAMTRFIDEIRIGGCLEHPNIAPLHDVGVDSTGAPFFVMKLIEGEPLDRIIARLQAGDTATRDAWPVGRRVDVVRGVLSALSYAHERGLVHRDVKPTNIMVGNNGEVVLTDWGLARRLGSHEEPSRAELPEMTPVRETPPTEDGRIVGTPYYMAPEQAGAHVEGEIDTRADLYSVGVLLHELVTLRHYLQDVRSTAQLVARLYDPRDPSLMELAKTHPAADRVPAELVHIARRAMRKQPSLRYQSAREMLEALDGVREGKLPLQCHVTATKQAVLLLARWVDRSHVLAQLVLWLGTLGMLAGAVYSLWSLLYAG